MNMLKIRLYEARRDKKAVRALLEELLDSEKAVEPEWPAANEITELYFRRMMRLRRKHAGEILVAEDDGQVIGFITVLGRVLPTLPDEYPKEYAKITELIVHEPYRGRGTGRKLIAAAEDFARQSGVSSIRLEASAGNARGRQFYTGAGYRELVVEFFKKIS